MKKLTFITFLAVSLLMSSCGSYEATGAYTGSTFGNMVGSAIGGIAGGWRGHEIGSLIGTVGGAAVGAAIGASADRAQQQRYVESAEARRQQSGARHTVPGGGNYDQSGFDPQMRGDDRIAFTGHSSAAPMLEVRNAGVYEDTRDGKLTRGETCSVIFEIANNGSQPVYDVYPLVEEATRNKHIHISPNMRIESIAPRQAVRYTAKLVADNGLRNGQIEVRVGIAIGDNLLQEQTKAFLITTAK